MDRRVSTRAGRLLLAIGSIWGVVPAAFAYTATAELNFEWGTGGSDKIWTAQAANTLTAMSDFTYFSQQSGNNGAGYFNPDFASVNQCNALVASVGGNGASTRKYGCRYTDYSSTPLFIAAPVADTGPGAVATGTVTVTDTTLTGVLQLGASTDEPIGGTTSSIGNGGNAFNYRTADGSPFGNAWYGATTAGTLTVNLTGTFTANSWEITGGTVQFSDPGFLCQQGGNSSPANILCLNNGNAGGYQADGAGLSWGWDANGANSGANYSEIEVRDTTGSTVIDTLSGVLASLSIDGAGNVTTNSGEYRRATASSTCTYNHLRWNGSGISCGSLTVGTLEITGVIEAPPAPEAVNDGATTTRNRPVNVPVLANDGAFGQPVTVSIATPAANGVATVTGSPGNPAQIYVTYAPATDYTGQDAFTYEVTDGTSTDTAQVTVNVTAPTALPDSAQARNGTPVPISVLANDSGFVNPVTVQVVSGPGHGQADVTGSPGNAAGIRVTYTPAAGYTGPDSFQYSVDDGVNSEVATVSITVLNYKANDDQVVVLRDYYASLNVTANDVGFKSPSTVTITQSPDKNGYVYVYNSPGSPAGIRLEYRPYSYGITGDYTETFRYQITDGISTDTATVTARVVSYAALDDSVVTPVDTPISISVAANDLGFGYNRTIGVFTNPQHGTLVVTSQPYGEPSILYTPSPGFLGTDTFEYAIESDLRIDTARVTVQVITDLDADQVDDGVDNCLGAGNSSQRDTDGDGYGNWCDADLNNDLKVNFADLGAFRTRFSTGDPHADFDGSGTVNFADLARFRALFGKPPGPSALVP